MIIKIRADEHISPHIVVAVRNMALSNNCEISSIHETEDTGSSDQHWITEFSHQGGTAIISADRDFVSLEPQVNAVFDTGLKVILLPKKWGHSKGHLQAAHILQWWDRIYTTISDMNQRECYQPVWNITNSGKMKKIGIDFDKAQRKRRKNKKAFCEPISKIPPEER